MSLLHPKYRTLKPTKKYLTDKVVLAQAWKKAHSHIRSTNWYADNFELDSSAVNLDSLLDRWLKEIQADEFSFKPLQLVPAPKSSEWGFEKVESSDFDFLDQEVSSESLLGLSHHWRPNLAEGEELNPLRPLAHIHIRDQTVMTALMMCLANQIEFLQGNPNTDFDVVHQEKLVNYGNRLYCNYSDLGKPYYGWGNSKTYNQYFSDYQTFLARPAYFGRLAIQQKIDKESIFEVHLDLEKFFDKVDREILIEKIIKECEIDDEFTILLLEDFLDWRWQQGDETLYGAVCSIGGGTLPKGIPQGLVAGGFLANIYLLEFDRWVASVIGSNIADGIELVDCCRYVDDMRLIISSETSDKKIIRDEINRVFGEQLGAIKLTLNSDKTKIESFKRTKTGVSKKLKEIQSKVSGPISLNEINEQLGHLDGLIGLAESLRNDKTDKENNNPLALIEGPNNDVREDTLLRFSANKITTLLAQKRSLTAQEVDKSGKVKAGDWDYLQERMARRFISCWSRDPSLVLLLKKGLELFPDKRLLKPVLDQLVYLKERTDAKQVRIGEYCIGEIFRHSATIIYHKNSWTNPAHADVATFFEYLQEFASQVIDNGLDGRPHLEEQLSFFMVVMNDSPLENGFSNERMTLISKIMKGFRRIGSAVSLEDFICNTLMAYQLANDKQLVIRSINAFLLKLPASRRKNQLTKFHRSKILKRLALESPDLFSELIQFARKNEINWVDQNAKDLICQLGIDIAPIQIDLARFNKPVSLLALVKRSDNPFAHENAALMLLSQAMEISDFSTYIDLANTKVSCDNWQGIQSLEATLTLDIKDQDEDGHHRIPDWVEENHKPLYRLGMFLRACLLGGTDWTCSLNRHPLSRGYRGIKTSYYKRQISMMNTPEALAGNSAPMSSWLPDLLFHLLQWPGVGPIARDSEFSNLSWDSLITLIKRRIDHQRNLFCVSSGIPAYAERVKLDWAADKKNLKVVMVQSLLPKKRDFSEEGILLNSPNYRSRHRRHIAAVSELILHKMFSHNSIDDIECKKPPKIDLIVWPELSVNLDDIDVLKKVADKTGAMIFAGLTFLSQPGVKGPNNTAIWIIPNKGATGRQYICRLQGKQHMTADEKGKVEPWRPYQLLIELEHPNFPKQPGFVLTGSICYDATDIKLSGDLKGKSHAYIVSALNQDVATFDSMVDALYYHMYQHVVLVNSGEFGGSVAKAPYKERYDKLITHVHGKEQVSISSFEMNMFDFRSDKSSFKSGKKVKTRPAG